jgi:hypothetical protein
MVMLNDVADGGDAAFPLADQVKIDLQVSSYRSEETL